MNTDTEPRRPDLSVEAPKTLARRAPGGRGGTVIVLLLVVIALQAAMLWMGRGAGPGAATEGEVQAPADVTSVLKAQALRLEEMAVAAEAAAAWEAYLARAALPAAERASLRYRAGRLWQEAKRYGEALAAYVRAEKEGLADADAQRAIGPRVVACLRAMGHYGAIGSELRKRTTPEDGPDASPVVATYAGEQLTVAAFERMVETRIEEALRRYQGQLPAETLAAERERMARAYRDPSRAKDLLEDFVLRELLVRRACELGLDREDAFRNKLRDIEALQLARALQERETAAAAIATESDVSAHYQAHRERYREPASARLAVIEVASKAEGAKRFAEEKLASDRERFLAEARTVEAPLVRGQAWAGYGRSETLEEAVFAAEAGTTLDGPVAVGDKVLLVHVIETTPAAIPPLDEVRDRVRGDYVNRKRAELMEALVKELKGRYEVRFHPEALSRSGAKKAAPGAGAAEDEETP